jgi:hypothetical protein
MGEDKSTKFQPEINHAVKIEFTDDRSTSNAGVLLLGEAN